MASRLAGARLEACGLRRRFGGVTALDDVDLALDPGEALGLIGPNGSGKTTFLNVLTGLYAPDAGSLTLDGVEIAGAPSAAIVARGVARTFQNLRLFRRLTVFENVRAARHAAAPRREALWIKPAARRREREALMVLLDRFALGDRAEETPDALSLVERRRLELARALTAEPRLLLLDEPAAGMTPAETDALARTLADHALPGRSVILIEHKLDFVATLCPRLVVLDAGRKIADAPTLAALDAAPVRRAYLGEAA